MFNYIASSYETSSFECKLNSSVNQIEKAVRQIEQASRQIKQAGRHELEERDEHIVQLEGKVEQQQSTIRELKQKIEYSERRKRYSEKENSQVVELLNINQVLDTELTMEKSRNEELRLELSKVKQELSLLENKYITLEGEHDKANHIIRTLVKKVQQQQQRTPMSHLTSTTTGHQHHDRIIT